MTTETDFAPSLSGRIADALLALLASDAPLAGYARGGITDIELEDLAIQGDVLAPAIWVAIAAELERRRPGDTAELETRITVFLLTEHPTTRGAAGWGRSRVLHHIRRLVLAQERGILRDPQGRPLTEALTTFQRIEGGRLRSQPNLIVSRSDLLFRSLIDELTGDFLR